MADELRLPCWAIFAPDGSVLEWAQDQDGALSRLGTYLSRRTLRVGKVEATEDCTPDSATINEVVAAAQERDEAAWLATREEGTDAAD